MRFNGVFTYVNIIYLDQLLGFASEKTKYGRSEGILRAKNAFQDKHQSPHLVWKFAPWLRMFATSDPETARVLMTLKPELVKKAGLSDMLFGDDPNGFIGGLLYEEGAVWQKSRKILTEEFNQKSLDSYVNAMDESVTGLVRLAKIERIIMENLCFVTIR